MLWLRLRYGHTAKHICIHLIIEENAHSNTYIYSKIRKTSTSSTFLSADSVYVASAKLKVVRNPIMLPTLAIDVDIYICYSFAYESYLI